MSQISSNNLALSAVQTAHQATQVSRAQDKRRAETQRLAQDSADTFEARLHDAVDADEPDAELPDRQAPGYEQLYLHDGDGEPIAHHPAADPAPESDPDSTGHALAELYQQMTTAGTPSVEHPLYEHLDVMG